MKKKIIIGFIIIVVLIFLITGKNYEYFNYKKIILNKINKENDNKNLIEILNTIKSNLDYHNDKMNKIELRLNQTY